MTTRNISFEDLLETIALEESEPSYEALTRWITRFPEHQEALTSFFATWAIQNDLPATVTDTVDEDVIASRMVSRTLNKLYQLTENKQAHLSTNTLLSVAAKFSLNAKALSSRTKLDESILMKLDRRRIIGRIPRRCIEALSFAIGLAIDDIGKLITGPPLATAGARHKSRTKPTCNTESFADAVKASSLSPELKDFWNKEIVSGDND